MKVRVTLIVDIDLAEWREEHLSPYDMKKVRDEVKSYAAECVAMSSSAESGAITHVRWQ